MKRFLVPLFAAAASVFDAGAGWRLTKDVSLSANVRHLLNSPYTSMQVVAPVAPLKARIEEVEPLGASAWPEVALRNAAPKGIQMRNLGVTNEFGS